MKKLFFVIFSTLILCSPALAEGLTIVFQKQKDPAKLQSEANRLSELLSEKIGIKVTARIPGDYASAVQALVSQNADLAYLDSVGYLLAKRDGGAKIVLAENRADSSGVKRTEYDSVFVVSKESSLQNFDELLAESANLRVVFTSPTSTSGYLFPYKRFVEAGLISAGQDIKQAFKSVQFAGSYGQALEQVALGRADVCAVSAYSIEGEAKTSHVPAKISDQLRILARTPGVPTHVIAARSELPEEILAKAKTAILALSKDAPGLFNDIYGAAEFIEVNADKHVEASERALSLLGITPQTFAAKR